jgi:hypothetical protein
MTWELVRRRIVSGGNLFMCNVLKCWRVLSKNTCDQAIAGWCYEWCCHIGSWKTPKQLNPNIHGQKNIWHVKFVEENLVV